MTQQGTRWVSQHEVGGQSYGTASRAQNRLSLYCHKVLKRKKKKPVRRRYHPSGVGEGGCPILLSSCFNGFSIEISTLAATARDSEKVCDSAQQGKACFPAVQQEPWKWSSQQGRKTRGHNQETFDSERVEAIAGPGCSPDCSAAASTRARGKKSRAYRRLWPRLPGT